MTCLSDHDAERLLGGQIEEQNLTVVGDHLRSCETCCRRLDDLTKDDELKAWHGAPLEHQRVETLVFALEQRLATGQDTTSPKATRIATGTPASAAAQPSLFGEYQVQRALGHGGMGVVYAAYDPKLDRQVAIKVLRAGLDEPSLPARFVQEAKASARVNHLNVVTIYGVYHPDDDPPYIVMELIDGESLFEAISREPRLSQRQIGEILAQVGDGLQAAHDVGMIHRDVKPHNIMLAHSESVLRAKVTDFGLARLLDQPSGLTQTNVLVGTPAYMSPEQCKGNLDLDARTDVYSLGATLYEALTGELPFRGTSHGILHQIETQNVVPPRQLDASIPVDLEVICLKAMSKEPAKRYQSARLMADDLRRWLAGEPILARPPGPLERVFSWSRRHPKDAVLLSLILTMVMALAISITLAATWIATAQSQVAQEQQATAAALVNSVLTATPDALPYAIERAQSKGAQAEALLESSLADSKLDLRERTNAAHALVGLGQPRHDAIIDAIVRLPASVGECKNVVRSLATSPDSQRKLRNRLEVETAPEIRARLAIVLFHLGDVRPATDLLNITEDPSARTAFIHTMPEWHGELGELPESLAEDAGPFLRSGLCLGLGNIDPRRLASRDQSTLEQFLLAQYLEDPSAVVHSAAGWALRKWEKTLPAITADSSAADGKEWFVTERGLTMIRIQPGTFLMGALDKLQHYGNRTPHTVEITRPFFLSDSEVTFGLFEQYRRELAVQSNDTRPTTPEQPGDHPAQGMTWTDAILFCNWLSAREGRDPCYRTTGKQIELTLRDGPMSWEDWECDFAKNGYRLPTEAEWEYACRSGSTTRFYFGDNDELLPKYGHSSNNRSIPTMPVRSLIPNGSGLFDMHGNVWEWVWDWYGAFPADKLINPTGPDAPEGEPMRTLRGGGVDNLSGDPDSAARGAAAPVIGHPNLGFRVGFTAEQ